MSISKFNALLDEIIWECMPCSIDSEYDKMCTEINWLQDCLTMGFGAVSFPVGTFLNSTSLVNENVEITQILPRKQCDDWCRVAHKTMCVEAAKMNESVESTLDIAEVSVNLHSSTVKAIVNNHSFTMSSNNIAGLLLAAIVEEMDKDVIKMDHLFKRSLILIKIWCNLESTKFDNIRISNFLNNEAITIITLWLFVTKYDTNTIIKCPFDALVFFLEEMAQFDWDKYSISSTRKDYIFNSGTNSLSSLSSTSTLGTQPFFKPANNPSNWMKSPISGSAIGSHPPLKYPPNSVRDELTLIIHKYSLYYDSVTAEDIDSSKDEFMASYDSYADVDNSFFSSDTKSPGSIKFSGSGTWMSEIGRSNSLNLHQSSVAVPLNPGSQNDRLYGVSSEMEGMYGINREIDTWDRSNSSKSNMSGSLFLSSRDTGDNSLSSTNRSTVSNLRSSSMDIPLTLRSSSIDTYMPSYQQPSKPAVKTFHVLHPISKSNVCEHSFSYLSNHNIARFNRDDCVSTIKSGFEACTRFITYIQQAQSDENDAFRQSSVMGSNTSTVKGLILEFFSISSSTIKRRIKNMANQTINNSSLPSDLLPTSTPPIAPKLSSQHTQYSQHGMISPNPSFQLDLGGIVPTSKQRPPLSNQSIPFPAVNDNKIENSFLWESPVKIAPMAPLLNSLHTSPIINTLNSHNNNPPRMNGLFRVSLVIDFEFRLTSSLPIIQQYLEHSSIVLSTKLEAKTLISLSLQVLNQMGPTSLGEVGKQLKKITGSVDLLRNVKKSFQGLKKFFEGHPSYFKIGFDQSNNPIIFINGKHDDLYNLNVGGRF
eukprot:gene15627-21120_t